MEVAMLVVREDLIWRKTRRWKCTFLQTADIWASKVSLESRITPRKVTLSFVGKTEDAIQTSWMTGNDCKHRDEPRSVASDFMGLRHMSLQQTYCTSGVPQSSVLGPILFSIYTSPIAQIAQDYNISLKQYADDTLLYLGLFTSSLQPAYLRLALPFHCQSSVMQFWLTRHCDKFMNYCNHGRNCSALNRQPFQAWHGGWSPKRKSNPQNKAKPILPCRNVKKRSVKIKKR